MSMTTKSRKKMARRKSINDIYRQGARIESSLVSRGYGGGSSRFQRVEGAIVRYSQNIARRYGGELGRRGYIDDTDRNKRTSRSVYMGLNAG